MVGIDDIALIRYGPADGGQRRATQLAHTGAGARLVGFLGIGVLLLMGGESMLQRRRIRKPRS
jgi:hypothetical protein